VTIAQLTLDDRLGAQRVQFNAIGRRVGFKDDANKWRPRSQLSGGLINWQQPCIQVWVGGTKSGQGSCPYHLGMWGDGGSGGH
jgi:hypothetical protein